MQALDTLLYSGPVKIFKTTKMPLQLSSGIFFLTKLKKYYENILIVNVMKIFVYLMKLIKNKYVMKKAILIMSFQYSVNVIGLPLYIDFWEEKLFFNTKTKKTGKNMQKVKQWV